MRLAMRTVSIIGILVILIVALGIVSFLAGRNSGEPTNVTTTCNDISDIGLPVTCELVPVGAVSTLTEGGTYIECGGFTYNLNITPLACDIVHSGMQWCESTYTTNHAIILNIIEVQENQTCPS